MQIPVFGTASTLASATLCCGIMIAAATADGPSQEAQQPSPSRIVVRNGRFVSQDTGAEFTPRGFNFVRLRPREPGKIAHANFDPEYYDPNEVDLVLGDMAEHGFNAVRVFIDPQSPGVGLLESPDATELSPTYMGNVCDFLERARDNGIYIILAFSMWGPNSNWLAVAHRDRPMVSGANTLYFNEAVARTRAAMLSEFVKAIRTHDPNLLPVVFAYELQNELCFFTGEEPLSLEEGEFSFRDETYDLSSERELQRLMDDVAVYWVNAGVAGVHEVDPAAMVSISVFTFAAVGRSGPHAMRSDETRDGRVPARPLALIESDIPYLDIHMYPHTDIGAHLETNLRSIEFAQLKRRASELGKPLIVGEFGAFNREWAFPDRNVVPEKMAQFVDLIMDRGFAGALYWTYDAHQLTATEKVLWDGKDGDGDILEALAGAWREVAR